jgi:hypothetical protein
VITPKSSTINSAWHMFALHEQAVELTVIMDSLYLELYRHWHPAQLANVMKLVNATLDGDES